MKSFGDVFDGEPEVVACAPGRVNLLGEHTDYNAGYVLPTVIPQKTTVCLARNGQSVFRVYSANLDEQSQFTLAVPPQERFATYVYGCVLEFCQHAGTLAPLDVFVESEVPMGAGLSSSAALEVATLRGLREISGVSVDDVKVAQLAQCAEVRHAGVNSGIMDQMASSLGVDGKMLFLDTQTLERKMLPLPEASEILVVHSGVERSLAGSDYNRRREECAAAARMLGIDTLREAALGDLSRLAPPYRERARHVISENARVLAAARGVSAVEFGELMNASHASLRDDYAVSTTELDTLAQILQQDPSVYGAKLTGAGFGGAVVALCQVGKSKAAAARVLEKYNQDGRCGRLLVPS
jgi:galactokinase